ncbi:MAG: penicillin-binding protein [Clostridium sp.]|nr:penicillin-binding protein [Clostridium sp.]MCM1443850.1 penicillin-binding protein [Candidatus Amulumruptor caecigallinarius]
MKKFKKFVNSKLYTIAAIVINILCIIFGILSLGIIKTLLIVGIIDIILFILPSFFGKKRKYNKKKIKKALKIILIVILFMIIASIIAGIIFMSIIAKEAKGTFDPDKLLNKESTILYDKDGEIIAKLGAQKREEVEYDDLPQILIDAIVATEDSRFFQHRGFDAARFLKASISQVLGQGGGGASTITMQVSKNAFTSTESSGFAGIKRKFTDIYLSVFEIEEVYTKEKILEFYVNSYYMGSGAWGVQQASLTYFNKPVSEINIAEAAMLAGLYQSPDEYDPYKNPEKTETRRQRVLYLMERHGYITHEEKEIAAKITVKEMLRPSTTSSSQYQGFIDTVVAEVKNRTGLNPYSTPMLIYTTMDRNKQEHVNKIFSGENYKWENDVVQSGAVVIKSETGEIVAIGTGRNRNGVSTFNYATMIKNQIGSTSKPLFDYGPGIEYNNWSTYQLFADEPHSYTGGGNVSNSDGGYRGLLTMRDSLKLSRNIPALKAFQSLDKNDIIKFTTSLGLSPDTSSGTLYETHSIGGYTGESPLTVAGAYQAFSNGGYYIEPHSVTKIIYRETNEEITVNPAPVKVMGEDTAYMVSSLLVTGAEYWAGTSKSNGVTFGIKTGTTDYPPAIKKQYKLKSGSVKDIWTAGVTPDYSIALWYGYDYINSQYTNKLGSGQNIRLFKAIINGMTSNKDTKTFTMPDSVVKVTVEKETNPAMLPSEYTPETMKVTELFKVGTEPTEVSTRYSKLNNVTNVTSSVNGNNVTLSWTPINTPDAINQEWIQSLADSLFENEKYNNNYVNSRLSYNAQNIGTIVYYVYSKDSSGNLIYLTSTNENTVTLPINSTTTYVIKTGYTIFKDNMSDGVQTTINIVTDPIISGPDNGIPDTPIQNPTIE